MIKLSSGHVMVTDEQGRRCPFDLDAVRTDLEACFADSGIHEQWLPSTIVEVLEDHLRLPAGGAEGGYGTAPNQRELDAMVGRMLLNAGYGDVAANYASRRGSGPPPIDLTEAGPWNEERILNVLCRALPIAQEREAELVAALAAKLRALALPIASDSLIVELGRHVLVTGQNTPPEDDSVPRNSTKLMDTCTPWTPHPTPAMQLIQQSGLLHLEPVSPILPVARAVLSLVVLAKELGAEMLTELALMPEVARVGRLVGPAMEDFRKAICAAHPRAGDYPARLYLTGMGTLLDDFFIATSAPQKLALQREISDILHTCILRDISFPMRIAVRD